MTDTADAAGDGAAVHRAGGSRIGDGARHGQPARSGRRRSRDQAAHARRRLHGAADRRLPLQRPPAADALSRTAPPRSTSTASTPATSAPAGVATSSSPPSARWRSITTSRFASASTAARSTRSWSSPRCRRTPTRGLGRTSEEILNECMVISAHRVDGARARDRPAQGPDHHLVQGVAPARSASRSIATSRARPISRCTSA